MQPTPEGGTLVEHSLHTALDQADLLGHCQLVPGHFGHPCVSVVYFNLCLHFPLLFSVSAFLTFNEENGHFIGSWIFRLSLKSVSLLKEALILCEGPEGLALFI